jgi:hypothetical protein
MFSSSFRTGHLNIVNNHHILFSPGTTMFFLHIGHLRSTLGATTNIKQKVHPIRTIGWKLSELNFDDDFCDGSMFSFTSDSAIFPFCISIVVGSTFECTKKT